MVMGMENEMKKLWMRAIGRIKDRNTLLRATLTRRSRYRNPDLEVAVIKATSHDDSYVDYKSAQRVFSWVRTSPSNLTIILWALTRRVNRTRDWVVALKSMILLHGVLSTKAPGTRRIGRMPFDLSVFNDAYTRDRAAHWARNAFVQAYFGFLELKSIVMAAELKEELVGQLVEDDGGDGEARLQLVRVQRWQDLLDSVLQVQPQRKRMMDDVLVLEAMDCIIIEVFELYSKICDGIATALVRIYTERVAKEVAAMGLNVLQKATSQGQDLSNYFEFCRSYALLHSSECPKIEAIPEGDFAELERIINFGEVSSAAASLPPSEKPDSENGDCKQALVMVDKPRLKTVVTDKWEVFDEEMNYIDIGSKNGNENGNVEMMIDPFAASYNFPPMIHFNPFIDYGGTPSQLVVSLS